MATNLPVVNEQAAKVVGIAGRTSNAHEMSGAGTIGKLWDRFIRENIAATIPDRIDAALLAVYTDYASDKAGEYTFLIGCRVKPAAGIPEGMIAKKIPAGRYAVFVSESGPVGEVVMKTWQGIWSAEIDRAYGADYEIYDKRARDPGNARVEVHVGILKGKQNLKPQSAGGNCR